MTPGLLICTFPSAVKRLHPSFASLTAIINTSYL